MRRKNLTAMAMAAMMIMSNVTPAMTAMAGPNIVDEGDGGNTEGGNTEGGNTEGTDGGSTEGGNTDGTDGGSGSTTVYNTVKDTVKAGSEQEVTEKHNVKVEDTVTYTDIDGDPMPDDFTPGEEDEEDETYKTVVNAKNAAEAENGGVLVIKGNAEATGKGNAVYASGNGSSVTVEGTDGVTANAGNAVNATDGATVDVKGNATTNAEDTVIGNDGATVKVGGNVISGSTNGTDGAVYTVNNGTTDIGGNVQSGEQGRGLWTDYSSTVNVDGNVTAYQDAVYAGNGSSVTVAGSVTSAGTAVTANKNSNVTIGTKKEDAETDGGADEPGDLVTDENKDPIIAVKSTDGKGVVVKDNSTATVYGGIDAKEDALTVTVGESAGDSTATTVDGDVTSSDGEGVIATGTGDDTAKVDITGSVTSQYGAVTARKANVTIGTLPEETAGTDAEVSVEDPVITSNDGEGIRATYDSNVTANGSVDAKGNAIEATLNSTVQVNGNAKSAEGDGIVSKKSTVTVTGEVDAEKGTGIEANDSIVTVTGDVNAANGITADESTVTVKGTVTTSTGEAITIASSGKTTVLVEGDVKLSKEEGEPSTDVVVDNRQLTVDVSGKKQNADSEIAVAGKLGGEGDDVQLKVDVATYVNKDDETDVENKVLVVPEIVVGSVDLKNVTVTDQNGQTLSDELQAAVKDNIKYIVSGDVSDVITVDEEGNQKITTPGAMTITKNDGTALERDKSDNYYVALAKEELTINVEVATGYKLSKFNLNGADVDLDENDGVLVKNEDGSYTLLVPANGSGVDLKAVIEAIEEEKKDDETDKKDDSSDKKDETDKKDDSSDKKDETDKKDDSSDKKDDADKKDDSSDKKDETDKKDDSSDKKDDADKKDDSSDKKDETDKKDDSSDKKDDETDKKDDSSDKKDESKADDSSAKKDDSASKTDDTASKTDDSSAKTDTNTNGSTNNAVVIRSGSIGGSSSGSSSGSVKSVAVSTSGSSNSQWNFDGKDWTYKKTDGSLAKGQWMYLTYNGHADWYYFDANGIMKFGWFQDTDGNTYYLNPISDGLKGAMKKGSVEIDGKVYVFSDGTAAGVPEGALIK